jgi:hypothetical protein
MPGHHCSIDIGLVVASVLLFLLPATSQIMITIVLLIVPAFLLAGVTGLLLGRVPMLVAAGITLLLTGSAMISMAVNLFR